MAEQHDAIVTAPTVEQAAEHEAATIGEPGATTEVAHESAGLPQFQFQHWAGQIGYLLILFAILYVLMAKVFAPRIRKVFDERRSTIDTALSSARSVQAEANAQAEAARQALADARAKATKTAVDAKTKAATEATQRQAAQEAELNAQLGEAETRIRAARDAALAQVGGIASETAAAIIEKLTGAPASDDSVSAALAKIQG